MELASDRLYFFWTVVTALLVFAMIYSWFIAIIVRRPVPGTLAACLSGLAFITGSNAFIRSGETAFDVSGIVTFQRGMWFIVGVGLCVLVVQLGISYNGAVSERLPLRKQWKILTSSFVQGDRKNETGTSSDCG